MASEESLIYSVVVNGEEQYSLWRSDQALPLGWRNAGKAGTKDECLAFIKEVWTDMTPRSLRVRTTADSEKDDTQSTLSQDPEGWDYLVNGDQAPEPIPDA